ncbi:MAG: NAD(P)-dependent oxidoreductase [Candidatus Margulisbacteria bacterium]|nr:NAD(P)-dependent oxidoreductase [Candidatus Margulisiibacteriota bacterium]MBU1616211.1 NAD(P)-dependent oxidoreductase [Candidatus Margulisiibacteriota bacterium]MBU1867311.1 NAD(P)-dependent oxidoreductase [Candidatus Margulisiibacteriota bacterium]
MKIFITGISGCVGHYLFDELKNNPDYHFFLLVRDPKKLRFSYQDNPRITILPGEMINILDHAKILAEMDALIHLAADWGGNQSNYEYSVDMLNSLDPNRCQKAIIFSTASILGDNNQLNPLAGTIGTHYIRGKYQLFKRLPDLAIYPKCVTLFPTWVLGGDRQHPFSHASNGIIGLAKWLKFIRFFTVDAAFHYIHARDIARIAKYVFEHNVKEKMLVLGNEPISASNFLKAVCQYYKVPVYFQLPIPVWLVKGTARLLGKSLHPWDLYCFEKKHFIYQTVDAATFGLPTDLLAPAEVIQSLDSHNKTTPA